MGVENAMATADPPTAALDLEACSSKCVVCLDNIKDPRLLNCLHSFCRRCVDQLVLANSSVDGSTSGGQRSVRCPVCRSVCPIPEEGAESLVADVTRPVEGEKRNCSTCNEDGRQAQGPFFWCTQCRVVFCKDHAFSHMITLAQDGHTVAAIPESGPDGRVAPTTSVLLCEVHGEQQKFHCMSCDVPVCGHCIAIGEHAGHKPIVLIEDSVAQRKERVLTKVDELHRDSLPQVEAALVSVDKVSSDLVTRADQVRDEIRAACQRVVDAANECAAKKLQQVENIEQERMKNLDRQHDHLKDHADSVKSVISFTDRLKTKKALRGEDMDTLLPLVEERTAALSSRDVPLQPKEHPVLLFKSQSEDAITKALDSLTGEVIEVKAWAEKCIVIKPDDMAESTTVSVGGTAAVIIQTSDKSGVSLSSGGDVITSEWLSGPGTPPVEIVDYDNGRFALTFTLREEGDYVLAVIVNGIRMPQIISRRCEGPPPITFNPDACQEGVAVADGHRTATLTLHREKHFMAVLAKEGLQTGQHQWKVRVSKSCCSDNARMVGVTEQIGDILQKEKPYNLMYTWNGYQGQKRVKEDFVESVGGSWKDNDIVHLQLDCDGHSLRLTNLRSAVIVVFADLPDQELFPAFILYDEGACMSLLE